MFTEKIELLLIKRKMSKADLAAALKMSPQNLYNKLKHDNFREQEMQKIADILNCQLDITMTLKDTGERF